MMSLKEMCMSSESETEDNETIGPFFESHYSQLLKFLPSDDISTMSILNSKWNQRVESHKIWSSLMATVEGTKPKKSSPKAQPIRIKRKEVKPSPIANQKNKSVSEVVKVQKTVQDPKVTIFKESKTSMSFLLPV